MGLLRARRRLDRVRKGVDLLHRKREALVRELFHLARPAADARSAIAEGAAHAYEALLEALAVDGGTALRPLGWPARELKVEVRPAQVWGLAVTLGEALSQTSRQVNTLERRVSPGLEHQIATTRRPLDEREREEHLRLRHLLRRRTGKDVSTK
jgi:vacuolar-type H+-ATPase subunit D/Vma8